MLGSVNKDTRIRFARISSTGGAKQVEIDNLQNQSHDARRFHHSHQAVCRHGAPLGDANVTVIMTVELGVSAAVTPPAAT